MGEKKEYRSAIRSRKLIRQAFMELLKEKSFEKITVTDIVKLADINRSTFYAHYPDVMGVIDEIEEEILEYTDNIFSNMDFSALFENPLPLLQEIVKIVEENDELYRLLYTTSMAAKQLEKIKGVLLDKIMKTMIVPEKCKDSFEFEILLRFFMGGVIDLYTQWLNGQLDCSLEKLNEHIAQLIKQVNSGLINAR